MKIVVKFVTGILLIALAACSSGGSGSPVGGDEVTIQGVVRDAFDWTPVAAATVETSPATSRVSTDALGRFAIPASAGTYTITASKLGFETATVQVTASSTHPLAFVDVPLVNPLNRGPATDWDLGIRATPFDFADPVLTFQVEVQNTSESAVTNVVVSNQLDAQFASMTRDDIELNTAAFPNAVLTLAPDGRSFSIVLGTLAPSQYVRLFTGRARLTSTGGVVCSRSTIEGMGQVTRNQAACVTWTT